MNTLLNTLPVRDYRGRWPFLDSSGNSFEAVMADRSALESEFREIDEERANYFLEVLPPMYFTGAGWYVSEPADSNDTGTVYLAVYRFEEGPVTRYLVRHVTVPYTKEARREAWANGCTQARLSFEAYKAGGSK